MTDEAPHRIFALLVERARLTGDVEDGADGRSRRQVAQELLADYAELLSEVARTVRRWDLEDTAPPATPAPDGPLDRALRRHGITR